MPKSVTITKEMIDNAALALTKEAGLSVLTARNIAKRLQCSTQPIYKTYENMDELKSNTMVALSDMIMQSITEYQKTGCAFLDSGLGYIHFAGTEKILFQLFSLSNENHQLLHIDIGNSAIRDLMESELHGLSLPTAAKDRIFLQTMIFTHGLAVLAYSGQLKLTEDEIVELLDKSFIGFINQEREAQI